MQKNYKNNVVRKLVILILLILVLGPLGIWGVDAFVGPTTAPGIGSGILNSDGANLIVGSSSVPADTRFTINNRVIDTTPYLFKITDERWGGTPAETAFSARRSGSTGVTNYVGISFGTTTHPGNIGSFSMGIDDGGIGPDTAKVYVRGRLLADTIRTQNLYVSGTISASNLSNNAADVSAGVFGSSVGGGFFSFPSKLAIATSTTNLAGLPDLSVYGSAKIDGNLSIGTSTPADFPLVITTTGNEGRVLRIIAHDDISKGLSIRTTQYGTFIYSDGTGVSQGIAIDANGNVRINAPAVPGGIFPYSFEVSGISKFSRNVTISSDLILSNPTSTLSVGATSTFATNMGSVGIGTLTPSQKLHVSGSAIVSNTLLVSTTTMPSSVYKLVVDGSLKIGGTGNVLQFPDGTMQSTAAVNGSYVGGSGSTNYIPKWTSATGLGSSIIYETAGGNIGISNTGPSYKLDVSGTFRATGNAIFSGSVGIGTTNPGIILDLAPTDGFAALKVRKSSASTIGVVFQVVQGTLVTGTTACNNIGAVCLANFQTNGSSVGCGGSASTIYALCADYSP